MKTLALRFADNFAPDSGTISEHSKLICTNGAVWYGKLGTRVSKSNIDLIMSNDCPKILLIHSGTTKRYWAYIDKIQYTMPTKKEYPDYYGEKANDMKTWFHIIKIERAPNEIMSQCRVISSGELLSVISRYSMSPFYMISCEEEL